MGLRFRKSFKIAPGVKINLNKKSAGVTLGTKGAHYTINTSGKRTASVGIPGTGLSYSTTSGGARKKSGRAPSRKATINKWIGILIAIAAIVCVAGALKDNFAKRAATAQTAAITQSAAATGTDAAATGTDAAAADNAATAKGTGNAAAPAAGTADSTANAADDASAQTKVWISGSGTKYHTRPDCSGMENATEITLSEALNMGKEACKRCD